jgi:PPOX class probable F420-dependent enzyme
MQLYSGEYTIMDIEQAKAFLRENHRGVLVTHRQSGELQTSPILIGVNNAGQAIISSRETAYKVRNLQRDPRATVCVFTERFFGQWMQIEGTADILSLPDALEPLVDYYKSVVGDHPDWQEYREAMTKEQRVLIRINIERAGPKRSG